MENVLAILLTGGDEDRLHPLTRNTPKPGIPFGGVYRIVDFAISNCINSDLKRILILTQGKSVDLDRYVRESWDILSPELGEYVEPVAPTKAKYAGTADAVYRNSRGVNMETPEFFLIAAADHVYKMNYRRMVEWHRSHTADITIATIQVPASESSRFGVVTVGLEHRVTAFEKGPTSSSGSGTVAASMGIYLFSADVLSRELERDALNTGGTHDFGRDLLPAALDNSRVLAYDFVDLNGKDQQYWRDIATIDAWYEANMDLVSVHPELNLYDPNWPIRARVTQQPPAKFVFAEEDHRIGVAIDSIVGPGTIVSGGRVRDSVVSGGVRINSFSKVERSILLPGVDIGRGSHLRNTIVCSGSSVPAQARIGFDANSDRDCGYLITPGGRTVVSC